MPVAYLITRGLGAYGGSTSIPAVPILSVADKGDGTGATATISGVGAGDTIAVLTSPWTTSAGNLALTSQGTRSGNGTVALAIANGTYLARATNTASGIVSASTDFLFTTSGPNPTDKYLEAAFQFWLGMQPGVVELVGNRIAGGILPEGKSYPAITFIRTSFENEYSMSGETNTGKAVLSVRCYARKPGDAKHVFERVREALAAVDFTWGSYDVTAFFGEGEDETLASPELQALQLFGMRGELTVWYEQNANLI